MAPPPFQRAVAYAIYQDRVRDAIHAFKYERISTVARRLGHMLALAIAELEPHAPSSMLVVPVPLHRSKFAERGFNQARQLAVHALAILRKTHPAWKLRLASDTLMRLRATENQAALTPHQRRLNVRRAFAVSDPRVVDGRDILLIDDIFTTGATARAASRELIAAGAASVWVATLARARMMHERRGTSSLYQHAPHDKQTYSGFADDGQADELNQESMHSFNQPPILLTSNHPSFDEG
jgi:ComF family protein